MMNVILDFRASAKTINVLSDMGYNVILTPRLDQVQTAICGHSDIMVHKLSENTIVVEPTVYDYFKGKLPGINVVKGKTLLKSDYPHDIAYNTARVGKNAICNEKYTDSIILDYCKKNDVKIINTRQGYAKCSVCVISDDAIITSDKNISFHADKNKIDVLLVNDDKIKLTGVDHGFIGGSTGLIRKDLLAVNGNINLHTDADKIISFAKKHNVNVISLNEEEITDIGSIIAI